MYIYIYIYRERERERVCVRFQRKPSYQQNQGTLLDVVDYFCHI